MGIVVKQTSKNIITISIALLIGGINTLYFYPEFLRDKYYGLVVFLLATSNLLQPLMSLIVLLKIRFQGIPFFLV